jgi:hypothetical protein
MTDQQLVTAKHAFRTVYTRGPAIIWAGAQLPVDHAIVRAYPENFTTPPRWWQRKRRGT